MYDSKVRKFFKELGKEYYVFGGKALSQILKSVRSNDWDVAVNSSREDISSVKRKLDKVFGKGKIDCEKKAFTQLDKGFHTVMYGCDPVGSKVELFDFKFEDFSELDPVVVMDGVRYADIALLYKNMKQNIREKHSLFREFKKVKKKLTNDAQIRKIIREEVGEYREMLEEEEDPEEKAFIQEDIDELLSESNFRKKKKELAEVFKGYQESYAFAKKVYIKNERRVRALTDALKSPENFTRAYRKVLCKQCAAGIGFKVLERRKLHCARLNCGNFSNARRLSKRKSKQSLRKKKKKKRFSKKRKRKTI